MEKKNNLQLKTVQPVWGYAFKTLYGTSCTGFSIFIHTAEIQLYDLLLTPFVTGCLYKCAATRSISGTLFYEGSLPY